MSFLDDLQKNINKAAKVGMKQTNKWIEIGKLNMALNAANLELQDLYEEIGEFVYNNRLKDLSESPKIRELFHRVYVQKGKIKEIQQEIDSLKKVNACENCRQDIAPGTKYCPYCSHPQSKEVDFHI